MPLLIFISLFTLLDFVVLFTLGSAIGLIATLVLIVLTGVGGIHLIRREGAQTLARARDKLTVGELPSEELLTGAALIFGGALLMAPGFLSDALGLACLIPSARRLSFKLLAWLGMARINVYGEASGPGARQGSSAKASPHEPRDSDQPDKTQPTGERQQPLEGDFISRDDSRR